jgi:DNA-binding response OmpR family regulator
MHALMLAAFSTAETGYMAASHGTDDYRAKPIEIQDLERKVASIIRKSVDFRLL